MSGWLDAALSGVREQVSHDAGLAHLFGALENEILHGEGLRYPAGVARALVERSGEIAAELMRLEVRVPAEVLVPQKGRGRAAGRPVPDGEAAMG